MPSPNSTTQIIPISVRQLALGLLAILVFCALLGGWLYRRHHQAVLSYKPLMIPRVIVHKYNSSTPDRGFESMSFALPAGISGAK